MTTEDSLEVLITVTLKLSIPADLLASEFGGDPNNVAYRIRKFCWSSNLAADPGVAVIDYEGRLGHE
jgi:hypothetical protein